MPKAPKTNAGDRGRPVARGDQPTILLVADDTVIEEQKLQLLDLCRARGWKLLESRFRAQLWPTNRPPRGAIVSSMYGEHIDELIRRGCPTVRVGRAPHPNDPQIPAAVPDLLATSRMAAEHFAERSFRHVAFAGYDVHDGYSPQTLLYEGFKAGAAEFGCECHYLSLQLGRGAPKDWGAKREMRRLKLAAQLGELPRPIGLFTFSDSCAFSLCYMCDDSGLSVPDDVAVLGMGNHVLDCECRDPSISSVALDYAGQADAIVHMLERMMQGKPVMQTTVKIPPLGVVTRESTNAVGTLDPEVGAAVRYMWAHFGEDLSVDDVARVVGLSSRQLARRFGPALGRTFSQELLRKRLEETKRLLRSTDLHVADIAPMVGFSSDKYLYRTFRSAFGITPSQYRREQG